MAVLNESPWGAVALMGNPRVRPVDRRDRPNPRHRGWRVWRLSVDSAIGFCGNAHRFWEFGEFAPDFEQLLLFDDASAARLSHRFFERGLSREQLQKLVD